MFRILFIITLFFLVFSAQLQAATTATNKGVQTATGPHITVSLLSEYSGIKPGASQWIGIYLQPDPQWHTYWLNPGDSGEAPKVEWQFSIHGNSESGSHGDIKTLVEVGDVNWPIPYEIKVAHLVNYGYKGGNLLIVPLQLSDFVQVGSPLDPGSSLEQGSVNDPGSVHQNRKLNITADLSWLVCKEDCIPGWATLQLSLPIESDPALSDAAPLFAETFNKWPEPEAITGLFEVTEEHVILNVEALKSDDSLATGENSKPAGSWRVFPFRGDILQHNGEQSYQEIDSGHSLVSHSFVLPKSDYFSKIPEELSFLISNGKQGFYVDARLNAATAKDVGSGNNLALPLIMLFAFAGGLILNLMPCVLPILAIKAMSIGSAQQMTSQPKTSQQNTVIKFGYLFGVMTSFVGFAIVIELLKNAGDAVGWGFHMQEPTVILVLCFLFLYIALLLFDIAPGGASLAGTGQHLTQVRFSTNSQQITIRKQFASQYFTGVLAVLVASPCTAPFMGVALGAAMVSSPVYSILIFSSLGLGFALPLTLLFFYQGLTRWIPKPGAWMDTFKQFLAFPMLATVIWLLWVFTAQAGSSAQALLMVSLLCFTLSLWAITKFNKVVQGLFAVMTVGLVFLTLQFDGATSNVATSEQKSWSRQRLQDLKDDNQIVLVNMTADWCITCKVNEQVAFQTEEFQTLLANQELHYLAGDWTNKNQEILSFLNQYDRAGVPLYVIYAGNHYEQVLPQILTPKILLSAIDKARKKLNVQN